MPGKVTPTDAVTTQPGSSKETKLELGKLGQVSVKPVKYVCSATDWIRYGSAVAGFSVLGCATGAALPLLAAFVHGSLSPLAIGCLTSIGTTPGVAGILCSGIYISNTPTK